MQLGYMRKKKKRNRGKSMAKSGAYGYRPELDHIMDNFRVRGVTERRKKKKSWPCVEVPALEPEVRRRRVC